MQLMHTDLPDPVVPAMSRCGILAISKIIMLPATSLPRHAVSLLLELRKISDSSSSRINTVALTRFGTSTPTALLLGIGASIRTPVVASDSAMSSTRFEIVLMRVPASG